MSAFKGKMMNMEGRVGKSWALYCWALWGIAKKKIQGKTRKQAEVSRSRNYALGKPGSMEPDST